MKYNITLNQPLMIENKLNVSQWCILDVISVAPIWCEAVQKDNEVYYWVARQKISEELKALDLKSDTIYRYIKQLVELGFINHIKDGKKDLIKLTQKGKSLFVSMSEKNPNHYVGKKSELNSEKNPTYNNTNLNNKTNNIDTLFIEYKKQNENASEIELNLVMDFIDYRKSIKDKIKTILPAEMYIKELKKLQKLGYKINDCIETMKISEWKTIKTEWIHKPTNNYKTNNIDDKEWSDGAIRCDPNEYR